MCVVETTIAVTKRVGVTGKLLCESITCREGTLWDEECPNRNASCSSKLEEPKPEGEFGE